MIVSSEHSFRFGEYKQWEADFLRHLLGHTTFEEEREFNEGCNTNIRLCDDHSSAACRIGKRLTGLLRHKGPLNQHMYTNGAVELRHVLDVCKPDVNPYDQFNAGRLFAAFIQGNNKQRYFIEVELKDDWFMGSSKLPWRIFIGCNQGHSTGIVRPIENSHQLTLVELSCLGWIFHVTDNKFVNSIYEHGLKRYNRDTLHFMYDNDNSSGYIRKDQEQSHHDSMNPLDTAFWRQPCWWGMAMICFWLQMVLFWSMMTFLADILRSWMSSHTWDITLPVEQVDTAYHLRSEVAFGDPAWLSEKSTRNTCHQAWYLSTWKMTRLLSSEFPIHLFQREEQQLGNSWANKSLRGICSCSTTSRMKEDIQKLVMMHLMDCQAH